MEKRSEECTVNGPLVLSFGVSRFLGIAPVWFSRRSDEWRIRASSALHFYGYLLILVLDACLLTGLVRDLGLDAKDSVRCNYPTASLVWLAQVIIILLIVNVGVYGAKRRINTIIDGFNLISKIPCKPSQDSLHAPVERKRCIMNIAFLSIAFVVPCTEYVVIIFDNLAKNRDSLVSNMYNSYIIMIFVEILLESQFIFSAMKVISALKYINECLENMSCNNIFKLPNNRKTAKETVTPLVASYCTICDVIDQLDSSNGLLSLLILNSLIVHVLASLYYILGLLYSNLYTNTIVEITYCIFHVINMIVFVEPGHRTLNEIENTRMLLSQLLRRAPSPNDPLAVELEKFMKQTTLNQVSFSPLGLCTLTRSLVFTMLSAATTYLVIILQFKTLDK